MFTLCSPNQLLLSRGGQSNASRAVLLLSSQRREQLFVPELLINMVAPKPAPLEPIITHSRGTTLDRAFLRPRKWRPHCAPICLPSSVSNFI